MTVKELLVELKKFPLEADVEAYEGEAIGISVRGLNGESGFIFTDRKKETEEFQLDKSYDSYNS